MPSVRTIDDLDVAGKRVLVRVDFNVPMKDGKVTDTTRIDRTVPSLKELADKGAKVIVLSHLGRPKGKKNLEFTQKPVAEALSRALGKPVAFAPDCIGPEAKKVVDALKPGDFAMLENVRFYGEEEKNDPEFARKLAEMGDVLISDAFSASHRAHASVEALARLLPSAAGRLMQAEIEALSAALEAPKQPAAALVGGAKISTKLDVLGNLTEKVDQIIIGGAMANTFLAALGKDVGKSLCEHEMLDNARAIIEKAKKAGCEIVLPTDAVVASEFKEGSPSTTVSVDNVPADKMILDVGPELDQRPQQTVERPENADVERPARRLRGLALRQGHQRGGPASGQADEGRQADERRRRRRHRRGAGARRRRAGLLLRVHGGRRLP